VVVHQEPKVITRHTRSLFVNGKTYFFFLTRFATFSLASAYFKHMWKAVFAEMLSIRLKSSNRLANTVNTANELNVSIVNNLQ